MRICFGLLLLFGSAQAYLQETLSESPRVVLFADFLTEEECDHIREIATPSLVRSYVVDENRSHASKLDDRRTSEGTFLLQFAHDTILRNIEERITEVTQIPRENGEALQVLHYRIGGEYVPHWDYFNPQTVGGESHLLRGGQRVATFIMYLHTTEGGGETIFPTLNLAVTPKKGNALLFYNCTPDGVVDARTLHGGAPVLVGEKWIATKWLHERAYK